MKNKRIRRSNIEELVKFYQDKANVINVMKSGDVKDLLRSIYSSEPKIVKTIAKRLNRFKYAEKDTSNYIKGL
ncbi:MAG TPA: hypothetical protein VMW72_17430 [Sedimentisphaerales bacterium]|nr:hypothetical protein [Sedimentisphaerales bacterium]